MHVKIECGLTILKEQNGRESRTSKVTAIAPAAATLLQASCVKRGPIKAPAKTKFCSLLPPSAPLSPLCCRSCFPLRFWQKQLWQPLFAPSPLNVGRYVHCHGGAHFSSEVGSGPAPTFSVARKVSKIPVYTPAIFWTFILHATSRDRDSGPTADFLRGR